MYKRTDNHIKELTRLQNIFGDFTPEYFEEIQNKNIYGTTAVCVKIPIEIFPCLALCEIFSEYFSRIPKSLDRSE